MPAPDQILNALTALANQWKPLAIAWHLYFAVLVALVIAQRPSRRLMGILLSLPLISVSILAWYSGNPFNGVLFAAAAITLLVLAARLPDERVELASTWLAGAGAVMFVFGWLYPHFLDTTSFLPYLYAAPVGLVPCPTLSIVIGAALMLHGLASRAWSLVLAAMGIFYGIFGALRLGVTIDFVLLIGALVLVAVVLMPGATARKHLLAHCRSADVAACGDICALYTAKGPPMSKHAPSESTVPQTSPRRETGKTPSFLIPIFKLPVLLYRLHLGWLFGRRFMQLTHIGRHSGKVRRTVLAVLRLDEQTQEIYAVSAWKGSDWYANIQAAPALEVKCGFVRYVPVQRPLSPEEITATFTEYRRQHPIFSRIICRIPDWKWDSTDEEFLALARTLRGVAFRPK